MRTIAKLLPAMLIATALAMPAHAMTGMTSQKLEGRQVIGMNGNGLGYILAVNDRARTIELQTPGGIAVSMPESRLRMFGGQVFAMNTTRHDVLAMEQSQTGHTMATDIDLRPGHLPG